MLHVHRSERADRLVEALGDLLAEPPSDPMAAEVVAVPSRGVERWITQRLSHRLGTGTGRDDGVCANIRFPFPAGVVGSALSCAAGVDPDRDPWTPDRAVWPLLELVDRHLDEGFLAPLTGYLRAATQARDGHLRRFSALRHLSDLYDRYGVHRPEMVTGWLEGDDQPVAGDPARAWQAELFRRLRDRIGVPSPAERFEEAARLLESGSGDPVDLPQRLSLFGLTRLPASYLMVLRALARHRDVHLYLLHPSADLWQKVEAVAPGVPVKRSEDPSAAIPANPLLRSWGRDVREMQLVLGGDAEVSHHPVDEPEPASPVTLLGRIQADIRADRPPPGPPLPDADDERLVLHEDDHSLSIHSCHGRARQVEVMRDAITHLLAEDDTLEPRDVIVMCPDVEAFASLVRAAFGAEVGPRPSDDDEPGHDQGTAGPALRVRLADRSLRQTNGMLATAALLLDRAGARLTASEVLELASLEPVSRRFGFGEEELAQIEDWIRSSGARWGLDGAHRTDWGLDGLGANTWSAGLDRLLLGVAMADEDQRLFSGVLPVDDVAGSDVDLAGRLAELINRLGKARRSLSGVRLASEWSRAILEATESVAKVPVSQAWQRQQLRWVLAEAADAAGGDGPPVDLFEIRALLKERLAGRPTRANFRTGDLTVCTLVPMRSVPHRVVGLLGLDDGVFPRHTDQDGDDLLLADPMVGDRDRRSEDRQLLLDALLAATDHLIVTYSGRDERTNQRRPPAVPASELIDAVDRTAVCPGGRARDAVVIEHPLQSFDPRNFVPGALNRPGPWSFDSVGLSGAQALARTRATAGGRRGARTSRPFLSEPLAPLDTPVLELESLVRFVRHPIREFLRQRMGIHLGGSDRQVGDSIPLDLDALEAWTIGDRLLAARLGGAEREEAVAAEAARGELPPGALAGAELDKILGHVDRLVSVALDRPSGGTTPRSVEVNVRLDDGRLLTGTVPGVRDGTILECNYSTLAPKHRLPAWVRFLALAAARPELTVRSVTVGRGDQTGPRVSKLRALHPEPGPRRAAALHHLGQLVDLYDRAMREPVPLFCETSAGWVEVGRTSDPMPQARLKWEGSDFRPGERADQEHVVVYGEATPLRSVLSETPREDEAGRGWDTSERNRLGRLAHRLWDPLLEHEQVVRG